MLKPEINAIEVHLHISNNGKCLIHTRFIFLSDLCFYPKQSPYGMVKDIRPQLAKLRSEIVLYTKSIMSETKRVSEVCHLKTAFWYTL